MDNQNLLSNGYPCKLQQTQTQNFSNKLSLDSRSEIQTNIMPQDESDLLSNINKTTDTNNDNFSVQFKIDSIRQRSQHSSLKSSQSFIDLNNMGIKNLIIDQVSRMCPIHPQKKARYKKSKNDCERFCSKCALNMALRGEEILEVLSNDQKYKKDQIDIYLLKLQRQLDQFVNIKQKLPNEEEILQNCKKEVEKINNLYQQIELMVQQEKQRLVNQITVKQQEAIGLIKDIKYQQGQYEQELNKINVDIQSNYDKIIREMEMTPFQDVINQYFSKIKDIEKYNIEVQNKYIELQQVDDNEITQFKQGFIQKPFIIKNRFVNLVGQQDLYEVQFSNKDNALANNLGSINNCAGSTAAPKNPNICSNDNIKDNPSSNSNKGNKNNSDANILIVNKDNSINNKSNYLSNKDSFVNNKDNSINNKTQLMNTKDNLVTNNNSKNIKDSLQNNKDNILNNSNTKSNRDTQINRPITQDKRPNEEASSLSPCNDQSPKQSSKVLNQQQLHFKEDKFSSQTKSQKLKYSKVTLSQEGQKMQQDAMSDKKANVKTIRDRKQKENVVYTEPSVQLSNSSKNIKYQQIPVQNCKRNLNEELSQYKHPQKKVPYVNIDFRLNKQQNNNTSQTINTVQTLSSDSFDLQKQANILLKKCSTERNQIYQQILENHMKFKKSLKKQQ